MIQQEWNIMTEGGGKLVQFTSMLGIDIRNEGTALSYPVELGSFASYNKVQSPLDIVVSLAKWGTHFEFSDILKTLDEYQAEAKKLLVVTPSAFFDSMTLESYEHRHDQRRNANMLTVDLHLVEVKEVNAETASPRNGTSAGKVNSGKKQAQSGDSGNQKRKSILRKIFD